MEKLLVVLIWLGHLLILPIVSSTTAPSDLHKIVASNREDLLRLFGTDSVDSVPDYEVAPIHHDRERRDLSGTKHYRLSAFDKDFHLELTPKHDVVSSSLEVMRKTSRDQWEKELYVPDGVFYQGHEKSDPDSHIAVRDMMEDGKLTGAIVKGQHMYQIHPIPDHVARQMGGETRGHHVITRRSLKNTLKDFHIKPARAFQKDVHIQEDTKSRMRRETGERQYYIEAMLTMDKVSCDHYGNMTMEFILGVANLVNRLFKDKSLTFNVTWTLTKIILVQKYEEALDFQKQDIDSAVSYLYKFSPWARAKNTENGQVGHFDNGALLSRRICGKNYCDLDGVAFSGVPCSTVLGFTVNRATSFDAAFSVAHEMGHNFGLGHDSGTCRRGFIMNSNQASGVNAFKWSSCSNKKLQTNFKRNTCYNNKPPTNYTLPVIPPGNSYDATKQCQLLHGNEYTVCPITKNSCTSLFCYRRGGCSSSGAPPVDGTPCGHRKWCIRGECVDIGDAVPPAIHGGWGDWGPYSSCSRTCGGGIMYRTRECNNPRPKNHGDTCPGSSRGKWKICNTTECPAGTQDYRKTQCLAKDSRYNDFYGREGCNLLCRKGSIVTAEGSVADGTKYTLLETSNRDICIGGTRQSVGCDNVLYSGSINDRCMHCHGNGSECVKFTGSYNKNWRRWGSGNADPMFVIPAGSAQFFIKENKATHNVLNMKLDIPGNKRLIFPDRPKTSVRTAAGVSIKYNISNSNLNYAESMGFVGPSNAGLVAMFVWVGYESNSGYKYSYFKPGVAPETSFIWKVVVQGSCSRTCAYGSLRRKVTCHRQDDQSEVSGIHCNSARPPDVISCNKQPCPGRWEPQLWGPCSTKCAGGKQTRDVPCVQEIQPNNYTIVSDSNCNITEQPSLIEDCNIVNCPPEWVVGEWSTCTEVGPSTFLSNREVLCRTKLANKTILYHNFTTCTEVSNGFVPPSEKKCTPSTSPPDESTLTPTTRILTIIPVRGAPGSGRRSGDESSRHLTAIHASVAVIVVIVVLVIIVLLVFLYRRGSLACINNRFGQEQRVHYMAKRKLSLESIGSCTSA